MMVVSTKPSRETITSKNITSLIPDTALITNGMVKEAMEPSEYQETKAWAAPSLMWLICCPYWVSIWLTM